MNPSSCPAFQPAAELTKIFADHGVLPGHHIIAYCQIGMRASVDLFAMHLIGYGHLRNYYGAWEEWGNRDDVPTENPRRPKRPAQTR